MRPDVFILARSKKRRVYSAKLERELRARGMNVYRVTAGRVPKYRPERVKAVINYGVSAMPVWADRLPRDVVWFNHPRMVSISANKWNSILWMHDNHPHLNLDWTGNYSEAREWLNNGEPVVVRHMLRSHSGRGVELVFPGDEAPWDMNKAHLFTKLYLPKSRDEHVREYRFYIVNGVCVDVAEKRRYGKDRREMMGIEDTPISKYVRTNANGWVFARNTMSIREDTLRHLKGQVEQLADDFGLGFGGIDCIARLGPRDDEGYRELIEWRVVEPNTAIGLRDSNTLRAVCDELGFQINRLTNRRAAA